jgi:hypothetical protein
MWWGSKEMRLRIINLKEDTVRFRLVQALSESNSPTSSIAVLCREKIGCPGWAAGCYLYRLDNCLINMASFQFCYNINKHVPDWDSRLGLRSTSWAATAIGPLAWVTFVVSSLAPEHVIKLGNFDSRSGYQPIGKHWLDALVEPDFMRWDPLIGFMPSSVSTVWTCFPQCYSGLMICSSHLDESTTRVKGCATVMSLCTFSG